MEKKKSNLHLHIVKRAAVSKKSKILNKCLSILSAFILCALVCEVFCPSSFFGFFESTFFETFLSIDQVLNVFKETAIILGISLALLPVFKMKYWNLGAEGQVVLGAFAAALVSKYIGPNVSGFVCVLLMILAAIIFGGLWSLIPAIFRAHFNTNETLFTLMFNYIAIGIVKASAQIIDKSHGLINGLEHGIIGVESGMEYFVPIIVVAVMFVFIVVYLKKSKHGYELNVVGENVNTAQYVGIKVKKVILRTAILSGVICGIIGFLLVSISGQVDENIAGGNGFTAVLVVWLGHFNPTEIILSSFLIKFLSNGADNAQTMFNLGSSFPSVCMGIFFFTILIGEFFINYKIVFGKKDKVKLGRENQ